jgi:uncharacterized protein (TIGR03083 family)
MESMPSSTESIDYAELHGPMTDRLVALARSLSHAQWTSPSLCDGWRVCDVYGHMTYGGVTPLRKVLPILLFVYRGNLNRGSKAVSVKYADSHSQSEVIAEFERSSHAPVGIGKRIKPNEVFLDHVVHELDVRRPLALASEFSPHERQAALRAAVAVRSPLIAPSKNASGFRLAADDVDWSHGPADAPAVEGPADDLLLALCGRPAGLAALRGDGVEALSGRIRR